MTFPLDPKPDDMRAMGEAAVGYLTEFISRLDDMPAAHGEGSLEAALGVRGAPSEDGVAFGDLMRLVSLMVDRSLEPAGPGYLAYIPGGGLFASALGQFLASGVNRFPNLWEQAPVAVQIELNVIRWLADLFGLPPDAGGLLQDLRWPDHIQQKRRRLNRRGKILGKSDYAQKRRSDELKRPEIGCAPVGTRAVQRIKQMGVGKTAAQFHCGSVGYSQCVGRIVIAIDQG